MRSNNLWKVLFLAFLFLLIWGGLGNENFFVPWAGATLFSFILLLLVFSGNKFKLPSGSREYFVFLVLFAVSLVWGRNFLISFKYFLLFLSGGLLWVVFYNSRNKSVKWFGNLIIFLGAIFGALFLYYRLLPAQVASFSLQKYSNVKLNHHHIGDLWAIVLTVILYKLYSEKTKTKYLFWLLVPFGVYFLAMSLSRSSYIALGLGSIYLAKKLGLFKKAKFSLALFLIIALGMFLIVGSEKSVILSRQYFLQGIVGIIRNPQGVGVGNFGLISADPLNHIFGFSGFSSVAHNIILEMLAGMGILGLVFVYWFFKIIFEFWEKSDKKNILYRTVFVTLSVNFLFDFTYFIPTMLWLWFASLGLSQKGK